MVDEKPADWDEQVVVTDRPQDVPPPNSTFAERAAARQPKQKAVQSGENKAVTSAARKGK